MALTPAPFSPIVGEAITPSAPWRALTDGVTSVDVFVDSRRVAKPLLDGMNFQRHTLGGANQQPNISDVETNLQRFAVLGIDIRFTELDVRIPVKDGAATVTDLDRQRLPRRL